MVQPGSSGKNIWVAASDGDLERVRYWIEDRGLSPNVKDDNSYTPMHAAASYAHLELLEYLISKGGDINLPDEEGETPLYTVESIGTTQRLIELGADPAHVNGEGQTAADFLENDHPEISSYLRSLLPSSASADQTAESSRIPSHASAPNAVSALALDSFASDQTSGLLAESRWIMEECERDGTDPEDRLRALVEGAVRDGILFGGRVGDQITSVSGDRRGAVGQQDENAPGQGAGAKRARGENGG